MVAAAEDEEHALLAGAGIVLTDRSGALRHEQVATGRAVVDGAGHLRGQLPWQVGAEAGDECGRDHRAGLEHVRTGWGANAVRADGAPIDVAGRNASPRPSGCVGSSGALAAAVDLSSTGSWT